MEDLSRETDLYEVKLRRQAGRFWVIGGVVATVVVLVVVCVAPTHVLFYGMFAVGVGAIMKGSLQLSAAKQLEEQVRERDEDRRRAADDARARRRLERG